MSGRTSNLSFNRVDCEVRERLLRLAPGPLLSMLLSMTLPPADDEDRRAEATLRRHLAEERSPLEKSLLEQHTLLPCLRVDRERYSRRAIELLEEEQGEFPTMRETLTQLAFPAGTRRMGGELWLTAPLVVLSMVEPRVARDLLSAATSMFECAEPFVPFEGIPPALEAMGGLDADGEPKDQVFDAPSVLAITTALDSRPRVLESIPHFLKVAIEALYLWVPEDRELPLDSFISQELTAIHDLYARAKAEELGVEVTWHPNP
jgi:hypothetical protein